MSFSFGGSGGGGGFSFGGTPSTSTTSGTTGSTGGFHLVQKLQPQEREEVVSRIWCVQRPRLVPRQKPNPMALACQCSTNTSTQSYINRILWVSVSASVNAPFTHKLVKQIEIPWKSKLQME